MEWYKSKRGWVAAVVGAAYFILDHWGRFTAAKEMWQTAKPHLPSWSVVSPWVPLGFFALAVVFFEIDRRQGNARPIVTTPLPAPIPPSLPVPVPQAIVSPDPRVLVNVTPEHLTGFFKENTSIQAGRLAEAFIGKWMKISGPLSDVAGAGDSHRQVTFSNRSLFGRNEVYMYFLDAKQFDCLSTLKRGDTITVVGKIAEVNAIGITLRECEIVDS